MLYSWDFGDGETSTEQHPLHRYSAVGLYTVSLTVSTAGGTNTEKKPDFIEALVFVPPPVADFSATPQIGKPPMGVQFTNGSNLNGAESATYEWNFGDGDTSTEQHPLHVYDTIGLFTVSLKTMTRGGEDTETKTEFISTDLQPPIADFIGDPRTLPPGASINFMDLSDLDGALNPTFEWNFGDGTALSTEQHPSHTYATEGLYTVSLRVETLAGIDTEIKINYIDVRFPQPVANFSASPTSGEPPLHVSFANLSDLGEAPGVTYLWDFGDMTPTSTARDPVHDYMTNGLYTVSLTVTTLGGTDTEIKSDFILVGQSMNFILTFQENNRNTRLTSALSVTISAEVFTSGKIRIPGLEFEESFSLVPGTAEEILLPFDAMMIGSDTKKAIGVEIIANDPISVYGMNRESGTVGSVIGGTTDGFLTFPVGALGTEYFVLTAIGNISSQFSIVASQDNTVIQITPTATTGTRKAEEPYTIVLDRLDVYQLQADDSLEDLTGTRIVSDKPVAVFGGNVCAVVPIPVQGCDYAVEQLPPVNLWGTDVLTVPLGDRTGGDTFRILAAQDGTEVTIPGVVTNLLLNAGEFDERILEGVHQISATAPILVAQFAHGQEFDGETGDPFMMILMPSFRFLNSYTFATPIDIPGTQVFNNNFINIVAADADVADALIFVDGDKVLIGSFIEIPGTGFSAAQVPIDVGSHIVRGVRDPIGLYIYGWGNFEAYGYPGGMDF